MGISSLIVLYTEKDANLLSKSSISFDKILTLTPDAYLSINLNYKNIIRSIDEFNNLDHRSVIDNVIKVESSEPYIKFIKTLSKNSTRVVFRSKFHIYLSMYEKLKITIPHAQKYYYISNNKILSCDFKKELVLKIITKIVFEEKYMQTNIRLSSYASIVNIVNKISTSLMKKFKIILHTGNRYGIPNMIDIYEKKDKNLRFISFRGTEDNIKDLLMAFKTLLQIILRKKNLVFTLPPKKLDDKILLNNFFKSINSKGTQDALLLYSSPLLLHMTVTNGLIQSYLDILKKFSPIFLIAYEMKTSINASLAEATKQLSIDSYLISHGTHATISNNEQSNYEQKEMATGVLGSEMAKFNIIQSDTALSAMKSFFPELNYLEYGPIMWAYNSNEKLKNIKRDTQVFHILHASTFKALPATRPWIFETSDEFYESIKDLIDVVSKINNTFLTIRLRTTPECHLKWFMPLVKNIENVEIKSHGNFIEDINKSDLLISNSSTTIEEAIAFDKQVLLWGYGARYSHYSSNLNGNSVNSNANGINNLREEIICIRDNFQNIRDLSINQSSKIKKTTDDFVLNSILKKTKIN